MSGIASATPTETKVRTAVPQASSISRGSAPLADGPVVLAIRGPQSAASTSAVAAAIAKHLKRELRVVSVVEPVILYGLPPEVEGTATTIDEQARGAREAELSKSLETTIGAGVRWTAEVPIGQPSREVADLARDVHAALIVVGAAPHRRMRHIVSGARAAQLLHRASCPVLSVAPALEVLPTKAVAAIDFSAASIRAARAAIPLMADGSSITLVHVMSPIDLALSFDAFNRAELQAEALRRLEVIRGFLRDDSTRKVRIETRLIEGDPVEQIQAQADREGADLIAVGTQGHGAVQRMFLGSVASELLHSSLCSVLASPPPAPAVAAEIELQTEGTTESSDRAAWRGIFEAFEGRNRGRAVTLEVDDPEFGAQVQARGYVLSGCSYDEASRRTVLMLASASGETPHLTRNIPGVTSIAIRSVRGRDRALELRHGQGHTLVLLD